MLIGCARDPLGDLTAKLADPDVETRRAAARALDEQPNPDARVVAALTKSVADRDTEVRYRSIEALGKIGPAAKVSMPALKAALQDSEKPIRLRTAFTIHKIDSTERSFEPVLIAAMREGDGKTLLEVGAMGKDAAWAVPTLTGLLSHESAKVRALAARTLGRIGPAARDARAALQQSLRDQNVVVQNEAKDALNRLQANTTGRVR